ncbi:MAG: HIT family protein [Chloroflexota bacterium]
MNQLWAPWRMPYLDGTEPKQDCIFCNRNPDEDEQNYVVYRGARNFVMLNLYPYSSGHLMVIPYEHAGSITALPSETGSDMLATAALSVSALSKVMHPEGFNLGVNQGAVAGAGIADHIHLHVVPRWAGDTNFMPVLAEAKVMPELLSATAAKLRPVFAVLATA